MRFGHAGPLAGQPAPLIGNEVTLDLQLSQVGKRPVRHGDVIPFSNSATAGDGWRAQCGDARPQWIARRNR